MTDSREVNEDMKEKAMKEFLAKVQDAISDLEFDVGNLDEDLMREWNGVLKKLTEAVLLHT